MTDRFVRRAPGPRILRPVRPRGSARSSRRSYPVLVQSTDQYARVHPRRWAVSPAALGCSTAAQSNGACLVQPGRAVRYGYPLFHTHVRPQLYSVWPAHSFKLSTDPYTAVSRVGPRVGVLAASSRACPGICCERGGFMTRGLGRIPPIRGTVLQGRDEAGNDLPAGMCTPKRGRTGHPVEGTPDQGTRAGPPRAHRSPGLAPGALGWPWHPRRLATARHRGDGVASWLRRSK